MLDQNRWSQPSGRQYLAVQVVVSQLSEVMFSNICIPKVPNLEHLIKTSACVYRAPNPGGYTTLQEHLPRLGLLRSTQILRWGLHKPPKRKIMISFLWMLTSCCRERVDGMRTFESDIVGSPLSAPRLASGCVPLNYISLQGLGVSKQPVPRRCSASNSLKWPVHAMSLTCGKGHRDSQY